MEYIRKKFTLGRGNKLELRLDSPLEFHGNEWYCSLREFSLEQKWSLANESMTIKYQNGTNVVVKPGFHHATANVDQVLEEMFPVKRLKRDVVADHLGLGEDDEDDEEGKTEETPAKKAKTDDKATNVTTPQAGQIPPKIGPDAILPMEKPSKLTTHTSATQKPVSKGTTSKPAEVKPTPKPAEVKPAPKPAEVKPTPKPAEVKPAPKPSATTPAAKPAEVKPAPKPAEVKPAPKPSATTPAAKPTEVKPAPKPAEVKPAPKPSATTPAVTTPATQKVAKAETKVAEMVSKPQQVAKTDPANAVAPVVSKAAEPVKPEEKSSEAVSVTLPVVPEPESENVESGNAPVALELGHRRRIPGYYPPKPPPPRPRPAVPKLKKEEEVSTVSEDTLENSESDDESEDEPAVPTTTEIASTEVAPTELPSELATVELPAEVSTNEVVTTDPAVVIPNEPVLTAAESPTKVIFENEHIETMDTTTAEAIPARPELPVIEAPSAFVKTSVLYAMQQIPKVLSDPFADEYSKKGYESIKFYKRDDHFIVRFDPHYISGIYLTEGFAKALGFTASSIIENGDIAADTPSTNTSISHICMSISDILHPLYDEPIAEVAIIPIYKLDEAVYYYFQNPIWFKLETTRIDSLNIQFNDFYGNPIACDNACGHFALCFSKRKY